MLSVQLTLSFFARRDSEPQWFICVLKPKIIVREEKWPYCNLAWLICIYSWLALSPDYLGHQSQLFGEKELLLIPQRLEIFKGLRMCSNLEVKRSANAWPSGVLQGEYLLSSVEDMASQKSLWRTRHLSHSVVYREQVRDGSYLSRAHSLGGEGGRWYRGTQYTCKGVLNYKYSMAWNKIRHL